MSTRYSGPATLRTEVGVFDVQAVLSTHSGDGTYSWGGQLTTPHLAALKAERQSATLALPGLPDVAVHVAVADLDPNHGGVLLRVTGAGRAPYETPEDRTEETA